LQHKTPHTYGKQNRGGFGNRCVGFLHQMAHGTNGYGRNGQPKEINIIIPSLEGIILRIVIS